MNRKLHKTGFFYLLFSLMVLSGCGAHVPKQLRICPGAGSASEVESLLKLQGSQAVSLKANGSYIGQHFKEGVLQNQESFNVKIWVDRAGLIRLQGDAGFDPTGIVLGSNEKEYWLAVKPKEISLYWWGQWEKTDGFSGITIGPRMLLEAMGVVEIDFSQGWSLTNEGAFDVLTKVSEGLDGKKVYIFNCDKRVARIEYFDKDGERKVTVELEDYKKVTDDFYVPGVMKFISNIEREVEDIFLITIVSAKEAKFSEQQRERLFEKPSMEGFEHIVENGVPVKTPE